MNSVRGAGRRPSELLAGHRVLQHPQHPPQLLLGDTRTRLDARSAGQSGQAGAEEPARRRPVRGVVAVRPDARAGLVARATDDIRYRNPAPSVIRLIDIVTTRQRTPRGHHPTTATTLVPDVWK